MITKCAEFEALGIQASLHRVIDPKQGLGGLFISNYFSAMNLPLLQKNSVKAIITIAKGCFLTYNKQQIPNYLYIPIEDKASVDISQQFEKCFTFIDRSRAKTNVLIHCRAGISRSATILIGYLMTRFKFSLKESLAKLKAVNPRTKPNSGFMKKLKELQIKIHGHAEFIDHSTGSLANPPKKTIASEGSDAMTRRSSLCIKARQLQGVTNTLQTRISDIKHLIEKQNCRKRSHSQFLRKKMHEMKQIKQSTIAAEKERLIIQTKLAKRLERNN